MIEKLVKRHLRDKMPKFRPYIKTSLPTNQLSLLKLHCNVVTHKQNAAEGKK
jgi:hypothetical protein